MTICVLLYFYSNFNQDSNKIAIATVNIGENNPIIQNHINYASKHGYDYFELDRLLDSTREPKWQKFKMTEELFHLGYEYVLWMDADAFFAECDIRLDKFVDQMIHENSSMMFAGDRTLQVNSGVMLWRNTDVTN